LNPKHPHQLLVVDDDPTIRLLLRRLLATDGYEVTEASDGTEALAKVAAETPHIVIADLMMPNMNGIELCEQIRKLNLPHYVYILLLTGAERSEDELVQSLVAGADDFFYKPISSPELFARLHAATRILKLESRLQEQARYDFLTGLLNRRTMNLFLEKEWSRTQRYARPLSCAMIDIDCFKAVNDEHGHFVGDQVLKQVATLLRQESRSADLVGRWGGEEFAVLLPETGLAGAKEWAERFREQLAADPVVCDREKIALTVSIGVAEHNKEMEQSADLLRQADDALCEAKKQGRNRVQASE